MVVGVPLLGDVRAKKRDERLPLDGFDRALGVSFGRLLKKEEFKGKKDQQISSATLGKVKADRLILMGLGDVTKLSPGDIRTFGAKAARAANADKSRRLVLGVPAGLEGRLREIVEGLELGAYRFTKYFTGDRKPKSELGQVTICLLGDQPSNAKAQVDLGQTVAGGVNLSRDLSNEPPNILYPETFAAAAQAMAKETGLKVQVFDYKEIQKRGMHLLQAVGQGSEHKPTMVHFHYTPAVAGTAARKKLVFVGKGITFDTGGISIKPAAGMGEMKHDMSGAANIVGLMQIVAKMKPNVEVHGIFAAAENMPDGNAYRPGDIWGSLDGKSVEIINTDAEGRLILADALAYARALEPDLLVDNATLTGACVVALGNGCSGWYASNEATAEQFQAGVKASGESMWRLPLLEELKDQLKSDSADLKHTGDRWGGSISAAMFLREFTTGVANWIHCDIAGPAMGDRVRGWDPKGGTGHGVLTFLQLVEHAAAQSVAAPVAPPAPAPAAPAKKAPAKAAAPPPSPAKKVAAKAAPPAPPASVAKKKSALPIGVRSIRQQPASGKPASRPAALERALSGGNREPQNRKRSSR